MDAQTWTTSDAETPLYPLATMYAQTPTTSDAEMPSFSHWFFSLSIMAFSVLMKAAYNVVIACNTY